MSYPSSRSFCRSGLRPISWCDIELHPILYLYRLPFQQRSFGLVRVSLGVLDGELQVLTGRRDIEGVRYHLVEGQRLLGHLLRAAIEDYGDLFLVLVVVFIAHALGSGS